MDRQLRASPTMDDNGDAQTRARACALRGPARTYNAPAALVTRSSPTSRGAITHPAGWLPAEDDTAADRYDHGRPALLRR